MVLWRTLFLFLGCEKNTKECLRTARRPNGGLTPHRLVPTQHHYISQVASIKLKQGWQLRAQGTTTGAKRLNSGNRLPEQLLACWAMR